jgi:hypothetical protein
MGAGGRKQVSYTAYHSKKNYNWLLKYSGIRIGNKMKTKNKFFI